MSLSATSSGVLTLTPCKYRCSLVGCNIPLHSDRCTVHAIPVTVPLLRFLLLGGWSPFMPSGFCGYWLLRGPLFTNKLHYEDCTAISETAPNERLCTPCIWYNDLLMFTCVQPHVWECQVVPPRLRAAPPAGLRKPSPASGLCNQPPPGRLQAGWGLGWTHIG